IGGIGLLRQHLGNRQLGFLDPGININGTPLFADTGLLPPAGTPPVLNTHDVSPDMHFGGKGGLQFRDGDFAFELCGFYLPQAEESHITAIPSRLTLGFAYFPTPIGFTVNNGLWAQADVVKLSLQNALANGEANFRWKTCPTFEWLLGVRYVDFQERYSIFTYDDIL